MKQFFCLISLIASIPFLTIGANLLAFACKDESIDRTMSDKVAKYLRSSA